MNTITLTVHGVSFVMEATNDFVAEALYSGQVWETTALGEWIKECEKVDGLVMDVGAYTGIYSILAAKANPLAKILAFEPLRANYNRTSENLSYNNVNHQTTVFHAALSNTSGTIDLNITGGSKLPSGSSIDEHPTRKNIRTETITTLLGDDVPALKDRVYLIKMDVERHEYAVIEGLKKTFLRDHPVVFMEILDKEEFLKIQELMTNLGYSKVELICEDLLETVTDERIQLPIDGRTNYIFRQ